MHRRTISANHRGSKVLSVILYGSLLIFSGLSIFVLSSTNLMIRKSTDYYYIPTAEDFLPIIEKNDNNLTLYPRYDDADLIENILLPNDGTTNESKIILLWTQFQGQLDWRFGPMLTQDSFKRIGCPMSNCVITDDRSYLDNASVVLFHYRDDFNTRLAASKLIELDPIIFDFFFAHLETYHNFDLLTSIGLLSLPNLPNISTVFHFPLYFVKGKIII